MAKINILDTNIANMIAAGEVVERPSSVVKELVENSIDAGANNITIEIKNGGMSYIRVTDDGCGIEPEYMQTAFLPHATSKIANADDLDKIFTLGFRGEALASIAAVSNVTLYSKTADGQHGRMVAVEGGEICEDAEAGCADGTTVIVRNLFYNTPARMKFLKKDSTEASHVADVVNKIILGNPDISIKYINAGRQVAASSANGLESAIYAVFGGDYPKHLIPVLYTEDGIEITGFTAGAALARANRSHQIFYINGRYVMCKTIATALAEAHKNAIMTGKFPFAVLNVRINPSFVDVNVHPQKLEVRFSDSAKVFSAVNIAVKNALANELRMPEITIKNRVVVQDAEDEKPVPPAPKNPVINFLRDAFVKDKSFYEKSYEAASNGVRKPLTKMDIAAPNNDTMLRDNVKNAPINMENDEFVHFAGDKPPSVGLGFKVIGQIFETYIIVQMGAEMVIIDQHAAHERLFFESMKADFESGSVSSQSLLLPETIDVTPLEFDCFKQNTAFFSELGFEAEVFGNNVIIVRQIPAVLTDASICDTITAILGVLERGGDSIVSIREEALHTMACKKAVKGNRVLTIKEMEKLVENVLTLGATNTCPHGRPIRIKMTKKDLEKEFKRIVG